MQLTEEQFSVIEAHFPTQRGNVKIDNFTIMNAVLHVMYQAITWRNLPKEYGPWHTVYMRWNRWCKKGVMACVFKALQDEGIIPASSRSWLLGQHGRGSSQAWHRGQKDSVRSASGSVAGAGRGRSMPCR